MLNLDLNQLVLLAIVIGQAVTAYFSFRARKDSLVIKDAVIKTEINTNSMKDALVAATKLASHAEGLQEGRNEGASKAATLAQGVVIGRADKKTP